MNIVLLLKKIYYFLGIKIFQITNFFSYIFFDNFSRNEIFKNNLLNNSINKFHNDGLVNFKFINIKVINKILKILTTKPE
jgi:hypothetical protein